jgi:CO/xanthine dehydrogenase FAD-binding subunit
MILEYHRPDTLQEALQLLERPAPLTIPLGGGTVLSQGEEQPLAVVDLQNLPLTGLESQGNQLKIGAAVKLQELSQDPRLDEPLKQAIRRDAVPNLRNQASLGGSLVAADGRSLLALCLVALDAHLSWEPGSVEISTGEWLPQRGFWGRNRLLTQVSLPLQPVLRWESVARSPDDLAIICVAVSTWPAGRTRVSAGGFGAAPVLVMDGPEAAGADAALENALQNAGDAYASSEYRVQAALAILRRLLPTGI